MECEKCKYYKPELKECPNFKPIQKEPYDDYGKTMTAVILLIGTIIAFVYDFEGKFLLLLMFSVITIAEFFLRRKHKKEIKNGKN